MTNRIAYWTRVYGSANKFYNIHLEETASGLWTCYGMSGAIGSNGKKQVKAEGVSLSVAADAYSKEMAVRKKRQYTLSREVDAPGMVFPAPAPTQTELDAQAKALLVAKAETARVELLLQERNATRARVLAPLAVNTSSTASLFL